MLGDQVVPVALSLKDGARPHGSCLKGHSQHEPALQVFLIPSVLAAFELSQVFLAKFLLQWPTLNFTVPPNMCVNRRVLSYQTKVTSYFASEQLNKLPKFALEGERQQKRSSLSKWFHPGIYLGPSPFHT